MNQRIDVAATRFEQENLYAAIGTEPVRQHTTGRSGADNDVIIAFLLHLSSLPATWVMSSPYEAFIQRA